MKEEDAKRKAEKIISDAADDVSNADSVKPIIKKFSILSAAATLMPIPGLDIIFITPFQIAMTVSIAKYHGLEITSENAKGVLMPVISAVGAGILGERIFNFGIKTILPGIGGVVAVPYVFIWTYALGIGIDYLYQQQILGNDVGPADLKNIISQAKKEVKKDLNIDQLKKDVRETFKAEFKEAEETGYKQGVNESENITKERMEELFTFTGDYLTDAEKRYDKGDNFGAKAALAKAIEKELLAILRMNNLSVDRSEKSFLTKAIDELEAKSNLSNQEIRLLRTLKIVRNKIVHEDDTVSDTEIPSRIHDLKKIRAWKERQTN